MQYYCVHILSFCGSHINKCNLYIIWIIIIIGLLGKYNKARGAVEVFTPDKQNDANVVFYVCVCVCVYIFMGKLFIVCGELGSFPFIRMVNNKTIVLHLTRTYFCFFFNFIIAFVIVIACFGSVCDHTHKSDIIIRILYNRYL